MYRDFVLYAVKCNRLFQVRRAHWWSENPSHAAAAQSKPRVLWLWSHLYRQVHKLFIKFMIHTLRISSTSKNAFSQLQKPALYCAIFNLYRLYRAVAQCTCMHLLFTCFSVLQEESQSSTRPLIGNDTFIQNNWNHKTVGTEETFHKGTAFRVTRNDWTEVKRIVASLNVLIWIGDATRLLLMSNYKPSSMWDGTLHQKRSSQ